MENGKLSSATGRSAAPLYIAHRGSSGEAPENTPAAFRLAVRQQTDGIECDIHRTRDNRLLICHDDNTLRTTGADLRIRNTRFEELRKLDAGAFKGEEFRGEPLPLLSELLEIIAPTQRLYIELKEDDPLLPELLKAELEKFHFPPERLRLISFHPSLLKLAKAVLPECKTCLLCELATDRTTGESLPPAGELLRLVRMIDADGIDLGQHPGFNAELVQTFHDHGLEVHVWTVDQPEVAARYAALGVDSITTNYPKLLRDAAASA